MWKHVIVASIQAAFVGSILLVLVSLSAFGGVAIFFGFIAFPVAFIWCLTLAYPLIKLRQTVPHSEYVYFSIYSVTGFISGVFTPVLLFDGVCVEFSLQSASFLSLYGFLGTACAITAWNYIRKNVVFDRLIDKCE